MVELVIIVTATVVDPLAATPLTEPEPPKFAVPNLEPDVFDGESHNKSGDASPSAAQPQTGQSATPIRTVLP